MGIGEDDGMTDATRLDVFCARTGSAWRLMLWPEGWRPPCLEQYVDEEGEAYPIHVDLKDLELYLCEHHAVLVEKQVSKYGVQLVAEGRSARVLAQYLARVLGAATLVKEADTDREAAELLRRVRDGEISLQEYRRAWLDSRNLSTAELESIYRLLTKKGDKNRDKESIASSTLLYPENLIVPMLVRCERERDADALAAHLHGITYTLSNGTRIACAGGISAGEPSYCEVMPANRSSLEAAHELLGKPTVVIDDAVNAVLRTFISAGEFTRDECLELSRLLYERMRTAPPFEFAAAGLGFIESGKDKLPALYRSMLNDPARRGFIIRVESWRAAGEPSGFMWFREGYVSRPYPDELQVSYPSSKTPLN